MNAIKEKRLAAGLTIVRMAVELGVHCSTIQKWESGRYWPNEQNLFNLAKLLRCPAKELVGERPMRISIEQRNALVEENLWRARAAIRKNWAMLAASRADPEDVYQSLAERLIRAVDSYDPMKGSSLASHIYRALALEAIDCADWSSSHGLKEVPRHVHPIVCSFEKMQEAGCQFTG